MALTLFPAMWMLFRPAKEICEQAIEEYARHRNESGTNQDS